MPDGGRKTVAVDCLLLRQNPRQPPEEVMEVLPFREVVADDYPSTIPYVDYSFDHGLSTVVRPYRI